MNANISAKYGKLINDMNLVKGNINFTNEMIDTTKPEDLKTDHTLKDLVKTLTDMEPKLYELISTIENEEVMKVCLLVNDDLHKTFARYQKLMAGKQPGAFVPGESKQNTVLNPTHIYTKGENIDLPARQSPKLKSNDLMDLFGDSSSQP